VPERALPLSEVPGAVNARTKGFSSDHAGKNAIVALNPPAMVKRIAPALLFTALAACTTAQGDYPSLALRDAERATGTMLPPRTYEAPAPTAATMASVETLVEQANKAYEAFGGKLDGVRAIALQARGAKIGSDAWASANVAIADLETERSRTMLPLSDIDRLTVAAATDGGKIEELEAAQGLVLQMVEFETDKIDQIWNALRGTFVE